MVTFALAIVSFSQVVAPDSVQNKLQRLADSIVAARPKLPGLMLYVRDGSSGRSWRIASGWSDTARRVRLDPGQPLRIASNTKTYVAAAMLRLMERGTLALSDPLARHLPADLNALLVGDGYATDRITIEQVLSHRAGLDEHPSVPSYARVAIQTPLKRWTRDEQVRWLVDSLQPVGSPGERFKYSDTGYILLGAILERYSGSKRSSPHRLWPAREFTSTSAGSTPTISTPHSTFTAAEGSSHRWRRWAGFSKACCRDGFLIGPRRSTR